MRYLVSKSRASGSEVWYVILFGCQFDAPSQAILWNLAIATTTQSPIGVSSTNVLWISEFYQFIAGRVIHSITFDSLIGLCAILPNEFRWPVYSRVQRIKFTVDVTPFDFLVDVGFQLIGFSIVHKWHMMQLEQKDLDATAIISTSSIGSTHTEWKTNVVRKIRQQWLITERQYCFDVAVFAGILRMSMLDICIVRKFLVKTSLSFFYASIIFFSTEQLQVHQAFQNAMTPSNHLPICGFSKIKIAKCACTVLDNRDVMVHLKTVDKSE